MEKFIKVLELKKIVKGTEKAIEKNLHAILDFKGFLILKFIPFLLIFFLIKQAKHLKILIE